VNDLENNDFGTWITYILLISVVVILAGFPQVTNKTLAAFGFIEDYCGDGIIQTPNSAGFFEQCDTNNFGNITNCSSLPEYISGDLKCTSSCEINLNNCVLGSTSSSSNNQSSSGQTPNNDSNSNPEQEPFCGNAAIDTTEECDGTTWGIVSSCEDFGFYGGTLTCSNDCLFNFSDCYDLDDNDEPTCGNNLIDTNEDCDGTNLNNYACVNITGFTTGNLSCNSNCTFNTNTCINGNCGNNIIDVGEECDNQTWGNMTNCQDFGYENGTLSCNGCHFNLSNCYNTTNNVTEECGNSLLEFGEQCDTNNFNGLSCSEFGLFDGTLICSECIIDTSFCNDDVCGNGIINSGEVCDCGSDNICNIKELNNFDCQELGFSMGVLGCTNCMFDTIHCKR